MLNEVKNNLLQAVSEAMELYAKVNSFVITLVHDISIE